MKYLTIYIAVINLLAFFAFGLDKYYAKKGKWRISEFALLSFSFLGGSVGAFSAMLIFHHKTRKFRFKYGVPFFMILHIVLLILILK